MLCFAVTVRWAWVGISVRPIKNWITWADGLSSVPLSGKGSFITLCCLRVGMRTGELPSIWQVHKWLCLQLSLFARTVLSTLYLLAQLILQLWNERGITVIHSMFQVGNLGTKRLSVLSKVIQILNRICINKIGLHTPCSEPLPNVTGTMLRPWGCSQEEHHTVTFSTKDRASFLSLLAFFDA